MILEDMLPLPEPRQVLHPQPAGWFDRDEQDFTQPLQQGGAGFSNGFELCFGVHADLSESVDVIDIDSKTSKADTHGIALHEVG